MKTNTPQFPLIYDIERVVESLDGFAGVWVEGQKSGNSSAKGNFRFTLTSDDVNFVVVAFRPKPGKKFQRNLEQVKDYEKWVRTGATKSHMIRFLTSSNS